MSLDIRTKHRNGLAVRLLTIQSLLFIIITIPYIDRVKQSRYTCTYTLLTLLLSTEVHILQSYSCKPKSLRPGCQLLLVQLPTPTWLFLQIVQPSQYQTNFASYCMHLELPSLDLHAAVKEWQLQMHAEEIKVDLFFTCVCAMIQYQCYIMITVLVMAIWCNVHN